MANATSTDILKTTKAQNTFEGFFSSRTRESLRWMLPLIGVVHAFAAVAFWLTLPYEEAIGLCAFSMLVTVAAACASTLVSRGSRRFLGAGGLATCVVLLALCNALIQLVSSWSPLAVAGAAILTLAAGGISSSRKPLVIIPAAIHGWWALLAWSDNWSAQWMQLEVALIAATIGAAAYHHSRRQTAMQLFDAQQRFETQTQRDPLTCLPIRPALVDRLGESFARERRNSERKFGLCVLNLDGFQKVNADLGHAKGDLLLQTVAERLRNSCRRSDLVARLGGDEFVILLDETPTREQVEAGAERLSDLTFKPFDLDGVSLQITASSGVVWSGEGFESEEAMLTAAHNAMKIAKGGYHAVARALETQKEQRQTSSHGAALASVA